MNTYGRYLPLFVVFGIGPHAQRALSTSQCVNIHKLSLKAPKGLTFGIAAHEVKLGEMPHMIEHRRADAVAAGAKLR